MITIIIRKVRPTLPHIYWLSLGFVVRQPYIISFMSAWAK